MAIKSDEHAAIVRLLLVIVLAIVLVLVALPAVAGARTSGYPMTMDVRATAKGDKAMPFNFAIQPGKVAVIRIRNFTRELHTFAIPAIGLNVAVPPGKPKAPRTTEVKFVVPAGVFEWFCWTCRLGLHKHGHMAGKFYAWISPDLVIG